MCHIGSAVVSAVGLVLGSLMITTGSSADTTTGHDPTEDSWRFDETSREWVPAPAHRNADMTRVKVNHSDRLVIIRMNFVDLRRVGDYLGVAGYIRTRRPAVQEYPMGFYWAAGPGSDANGWAGWGELDSGGAGFHVTTDYVRNLIVIRIARAELDNPRWVKVAVRSRHITKDYANTFVDYAGTTGIDEWIWTPRVYR